MDGWSLTGAIPQQTVFRDRGVSVLSEEDKYQRTLSMIPNYVALLSALFLSIRYSTRSKTLQKLWTLAGARKTNFDHSAPLTSGELYASPAPASFFAEAKSFIDLHGGAQIYAFRLARLLACTAYLVLTVVTLHDEGQSDNFSKSATDSLWPSSILEWIQFSSCLTATYTVFLALCAVVTPLRWSTTTSAHLTTVLVALFGVCTYHNVWPLLTYTEHPVDSHQGALLWGKVASLALGAIVCPLFSPRLYVPFDGEHPSTSPSPEQTASWASLLFYAWVDPTIRLGYRMEHLPSDLLPPLSEQDYAKNLKQQSFLYLDEFCGAKRRHIFIGLMDAFREEYIVLALMIFLQALASLAAPVGMSYLLKYIESEGSDSIVRPWFWILWIFLGPVVNSLTSQWYLSVSTRCMVRAEGILSQLIFEHALRIRMKAEVEESQDNLPASGTSATGSSTPKPKAKGKNLVGKINNLVSSDLGNATDGRDFLLIVLYAPLQLAFCIWFLYTILEWSALVGLAVMVVTFPLPGLIAKKAQSIQRQKMKNMDARVQTVTEAVSVLRMIKLFGWESQMDLRIKEKRKEELRWTWKSKLIDVMNSNVNFCIPLLTMLACYATYTLVMGRSLSASKVFSSISVFDILRSQIRTTLVQIPRVMQGKVSLDRINEFLKETELLDRFNKVHPVARFDTVNETLEEESDLIGFRDASFTWSAEASDDGTLTPSKRQFALTIEGELYFKPGCVNLVIGATGSGKTSMLMALLGEMHWCPSGPNSWYNLPRKDGVAYAAQESWVQNETIRDNILFGAPYDEVRYQKVIHQCALEKDLALFEAGDNTEVGEKGLTLSGGQKARVTLARAVYSSAKILLLDDVLAALDAHTTKWIVQKCLAGDLVHGRTVILVTHNVAMAHSIAHYVVSLGANGRIDSQGAISDAIANDAEVGGDSVDEQEQSETKSQDPQEIRKPEGAQNGKLVMSEEIAVGHVSWSAFRMYLSALGGRHQLIFWSTFLGLLVTSSLTGRVQTWFLGYWATQYEVQPDSAVNVGFYLAGYTALLVFATVTYSAGYFVYYAGSMRASSNIHRKLILSVLGTTLRWLDTTPTSRVIARCTQDIRTIDGPLATSLAWLIELSISMLTSLGSIVVITPVFLIPGLIVGLLGSWIGRLYMKSQLSVRRELSNAKAPVLGHIGAAISGLTSIRAYGAEEAFIQESLARIDKYTKPACMYYNLNRWMSVRIDILGALFSCTLAVYLVYGPDAQRAANIGFSLNMAVGFSSIILWWVRFLNEVEVSGNSLERIDSYTSIEQEPKSSEAGKPPAYWPASGELRAENLSARYSLNGPKVLHDLSFHIDSGERVGIVGRTGSGKSSLTLALLRCIFTEGSVYFDGIPTASINLDALRSNISIIPQVPELLSGTLRRNLDPFEQHDDATLNDALRTAGLYAIQDESDDSKLTLDSLIASGGGNLSVGQRQILALARAMVQGSKLLILDEATSAVDHKTDAIIQSSLRNELNTATQIIVAHRLHTIMDADKIMVLDAGRISEFGHPWELLQNESGMLRALVEESGDRDVLYTLASSSNRAKS